MPTMEPPTAPPTAPPAADLVGLIVADDVPGAGLDLLSPQAAEAIGAAFATVVVIPESGDDATPASLDTPTTGTLTRPVVIVGHDRRESGPILVAAFARGLTAGGVDVVDVGRCSTDVLCFASGTLEAPAAMVTVSQHRAGPDGVRLSRAGARPLSEGTGLDRVHELAEQYLRHGLPGPATQLGQLTRRDLLAEYAAFLRTLVDVSGIRRLTVVVDAGSGTAGLTAPAVLGTAAGLSELPLDVVLLDGGAAPSVTGPAGADLSDLQAAVLAHGADVGLAFDVDAGRCIVVDERGATVPTSVIAALVGLRAVAGEQAAGRRPTVIHDLITSAAVPDLMTAAGADVVRTAAGRDRVSAQAVAHDAVFSAEHDGHHSFRDLFFAGSGMLTALHVLATLGEQQHPLSALAEVYQPYTSSGEIAVPVADAAAARNRVIDAYVTRQGAGPVAVDELDGLTVSHWDEHPQWWFNLRALAAEPALRLNVEAADEDIMIKVRDDVLALVRADAASTPPTTSTATSPSTPPSTPPNSGSGTGSSTAEGETQS